MIIASIEELYLEISFVIPAAVPGLYLEILFMVSANNSSLLFKLSSRA